MSSGNSYNQQEIVDVQNLIVYIEHADLFSTRSRYELRRANPKGQFDADEHADI